MKTFNSVVELTAQTLKAGEKIRLDRYYADGDLVEGLIYEIQSSGSADGYIDHTLANGNIAKLIAAGLIELEQAGGIADGTTDNANAIAAILDRQSSLLLPSGVTYCSAFPDVTNKYSANGERFAIKGQGIYESYLRSNITTGSFINLPRDAFLLEDFTLQNHNGTALVAQGIGLQGADEGAFVCQINRVVIQGYNTQGNIRKSVWISVKDLLCEDFDQGPVNFTNALIDGTTPTTTWNVDYFNNQNLIQQYIVRRGNRGPEFSGMNINIDSLTIQEITTGYIARFAQPNASDRSINANITIDSLYLEVNDGAIECENIDVDIRNLFAQGGSSGSPQAALFDLDNAKAEVRVCKGQEHFTRIGVLANNSELICPDPVGATISNLNTEDSTSFSYQDKEIQRKRFEISHAGTTAALSYSVPLTLQNFTSYKVTVNGLESGFIIRRETYDVFRWNGDSLSSADIISTGGSIPWTISFSANQLVVDVNTSNTLLAYVEIEQVGRSQLKTLTGV
jgi:hypothetical protein